MTSYIPFDPRSISWKLLILFENTLCSVAHTYSRTYLFGKEPLIRSTQPLVALSQAFTGSLQCVGANYLYIVEIEDYNIVILVWSNLKNVNPTKFGIKMLGRNIIFGIGLYLHCMFSPKEVKSKFPAIFHMTSWFSINQLALCEL